MRQAGMQLQNTCVAVLAAGGSTRMGEPKQLLEFDGVPLVRRACETAVAAGATECFAIVGFCGDEVARELEGLPVSVVQNGLWEKGQSSSVRLASILAEAGGYQRLCVLPADMPFVSAGHLIELADVLSESGMPAVASVSVDGIPMAPCLFDASLFPCLRKLEGDKGAAAILRNGSLDGKLALVGFSDERASFDVDTPADFRKACDLLGGVRVA